MNIFAANWPYSTTEAEILAKFSRFGKVEKVDYVRDAAGEFRGYCFVRMADNEARAAIDALHRSWMGAQKITVKPDDRIKVRRSGVIAWVEEKFCRIRAANGEMFHMPLQQYFGHPDGPMVGETVAFEPCDGLTNPVARHVIPAVRKAPAPIRKLK